MWNTKDPTRNPVMFTPSSTGASRAAPHSTSAAIPISSNRDPALASSTRVRLRGLPSRMPMVPSRSSPAIEADPIATASAASVNAP